MDHLVEPQKVKEERAPREEKKTRHDPHPTAARVAHPRPTPFDATRVMFLSPAARKGALANLLEATGLLSDLARICLEYYFCKEKIYATARAFAATLY